MIRLVFTFLCLLYAELAFPCASCGSGGEEPLVLYPNEKHKFYFGMTRSGNFENTDASGNTHAVERGAKSKTHLQVSYGISLNQRSFLTLGVPLIANAHSSRTVYGHGDPVISGRYTVLPMHITREYIPQVQILAAFKPSLAKSVHESKDQDALDVFANGYTQYRVGLDIWSGMTWLQYGIAQSITLSLPKKVDGRNLENGTESLTTFSLGHTFTEMGKIVVGISRLFTDQKKEDSQAVANSEIVNHSVFLTGEYFVDSESTVRMTLARQAAAFQNKNTLASDSLTVAYIKSL